MTKTVGELLARTVTKVVPVSQEALAAGQQRQLELTKPAGALGQLEIVGNQLCAIYRCCPPPVPQHAVAAVFCGDHGVNNNAVSPWPVAVTAQMALNICAGGAGVNAICAQTGTQVWTVDVGVATPLPDHPNLRRHRVRSGTDDITTGPAMSRDEAVQALEVGVMIANEAAAAGADLLIPGEVGIGNTTIAAALIAAMTGVDPALVTGRGAGAPDDMLANKVAIVRQALALHRPDPADPIGVLAAVGGLEHAAIAGYILGGAANGLPVLLDGVMSGSAALVATAICPTAAQYLLAGHAGTEPGIKVALAKLGLTPLVDLDMRLGEGSGAAAALPLVQASALVLRNMATFTQAAVSEATK